MPSPPPTLRRLNAAERTIFVAVGGILPPDLGPPPASEWTRAKSASPATGADLCVLSETDPGSMSPAGWDALAVYRLAVRAEGVPKLSAGDLAPRVVAEPEPEPLPRGGGGPKPVRLLGQSWPSMTAAAAELGVCRATVKRMAERAPEKRKPTPREAARRNIERLLGADAA